MLQIPLVISQRMIANHSDIAEVHQKLHHDCDLVKFVQRNVGHPVRVLQFHGRRRRRQIERFGIPSEDILVNSLVFFLESRMNRVVVEHIVH